MTNTINSWFHFVAELFSFLNPIMMFIATIMWVALYCRIRKELNRVNMKCYVLERQVEYIINAKNMDPEFIDILKKIYENHP